MRDEHHSMRLSGAKNMGSEAVKLGNECRREHEKLLITSGQLVRALLETLMYSGLANEGKRLREQAYVIYLLLRSVKNR
jgi:hypothetical protein